MKNQQTLPGIEEKFSWEDEWQDMPEYIQERIDPYGEIIVRFRTEGDMIAFFKLVDQDIPEKLKSIWYPKTPRNTTCKLVYSDES